MKAKILLTILAAVLAVGALSLVIGCSKQEEAQAKTLYTCGMHPQVIQDHPGNCPICGMKLTPIRKQGAGGPMEAMSTITVDPVTTQNMGLRTGVVTRGPLRRVIRTVGTVDFDETALADVTTKFKGWIEKLYVDATGQRVHKGDPLFEIYSPELFSAQTEYVQAQALGANDPDAESLRTSALKKLKFFDISDAQIAELERTREPRKTLQIGAPIDGFVIEKMVVQGQMVDAGMKLYRLADLAMVWVQAEFYEQDLPYLKLGQEALVKLSYLPDREFRGRVTYIYPTLDEKTRTVRVRMEFHNPGYFLKPGMYATVELRSELEPSALLVPDMAVLRSGEKDTVFVALDGGKFEPRTVTLGPRAENNQYEVLSGLSEGEHVVTSGQFLLDSESQLREAIQKMQNPGEAGAGSTSAASAPQVAVSTSVPTNEAPFITAYICPMPEHVSIRYNHPGKCPLCGMTLIPVSEKTLEMVQPGGRILYYVCPMTEDCPEPGHGAVHHDKPGKCPVCGMTLVPVMETPRAVAPIETNLPTLYTCPMKSDADVVSDKPGECPKCGMELVPTSKVAHGKIAEEHWRKEHAGHEH